jgi:type II secretory pathway component GspD/PulD (secretin)
MFQMWLAVSAVIGLAASSAWAQVPAKPATAAVPAATKAAEEPKPTAESGFGGRRPSSRSGVSRASSDANAPATPPAPKVEVNLPPEALTVVKSGTSEHSRMVYQLKNAPAIDIANAIKQVFRSEGELRGADGKSMEQAVGQNIVIVPEMGSNSLVISGSPEAINDVRKLVGELDQPTGSVQIDMEVGEAPAGEVKAASGESFRLAEKPAHMEPISRIQLTTMNNQSAFVQVGSRVPVVQNTTVTAKGTQNNINIIDLGLILKVTPRISADGMVTMKVDVVRSALGAESEGTPISIQDDKVMARMRHIENTEVNATVTIPNGQTAVLGGAAREGKSDKELVIIVTPHIIGREEAKVKP